MIKQHIPRRTFIKNAVISTGATALTLSAFNSLYACNTEEKMGVAIIGLGNYGTNHIAPALEQCKYACLKGIVTGSPDKIPDWKDKYDITDDHIYNYENFDTIANDDEIKIVYITMPNFLHAEFTIRAARAGKHVICEKPMAISAKEAESMITACKEAGVKLQIGYRLHHEAYNLEARRIGQKELYGKITSIISGFGFNGLNWDNWRFYKDKAGGGPLMDVGIYCLQACRYITGEEPLSFTAQQFKNYPEKFKDVEETLYWQMDFPGGCSTNLSTSYISNYNFCKASAPKGNIELNPAFGYEIKGYDNGNLMDVEKAPREQSTQIDAFVQAIKTGNSYTSTGEEGLQDMRCIEAIYKAMESGEKVFLQS